MGSYPHIVYGIRLTKPVTESPDWNDLDYGTSLARRLNLPDGLSVQEPDFENGWEPKDIRPVVYVTESDRGPYSDEDFPGNVSARSLNPEWNDLLTGGLHTAGLAGESEPCWYAFVETV